MLINDSVGNTEVVLQPKIIYTKVVNVYICKYIYIYI